MNTGSQLGTRFPKPARGEDRNADVGEQTSESSHAFPRSTQRLLLERRHNASRMWATGLNPRPAQPAWGWGSAQRLRRDAEKASTGPITGVGRRVHPWWLAHRSGWPMMRSFIAHARGRTPACLRKNSGGMVGNQPRPRRYDRREWGTRASTRLLMGHPAFDWLRGFCLAARCAKQNASSLSRMRLRHATKIFR